MASEDQIRRYVAWYAGALTAATQAIDEGKDAGEIIGAAVEGLSDADARNVLAVILAHQAQEAATERKGG
jgi:cytochrome c553